MLLSSAKAEIIDTSEKLIIPEGVTYTLSGSHTYTEYVEIRGTLKVYPYNGDEESGALYLITPDLIIEAGGKLMAEGVGYPARTGSGAGASDGYYGRWAGGGGYGGRGGDGRSVSGGNVYGSIEQPADLGSGGGTGCQSTGGTGGGRLKITVGGTLVNNGEINADGIRPLTSGSRGERGGGGSGGSIWIETGEITGAGDITAVGGDTSVGGAGGGGRIALYYTTNSFTGQVSANGGNGYSNREGGAGTIFLKDGATGSSKLLIDNAGRNGQTTPLVDGEYGFDDVAVSNYGKLVVEKDTVTAANLVITSTGYVTNIGVLTVPGELTLNYGGRLTYDSGKFSNGDMVIGKGGTYNLNSRFVTPGLKIEDGGVVTHTGGNNGFELVVDSDLIIEAGGKLTAEGVGYPARTGSGAGASDGYYGRWAGGGGYGGRGGDGRSVSG
ncbi:MAG: hypothetical protein U9R36_04900, partial [Elusimicrobiota bacterium]|nr:hypothetical protein [Elusimicrobiota bacterium]